MVLIRQKSMKNITKYFAGKVAISVAFLVLSLLLMLMSIWFDGFFFWGLVIFVITILCNSIVQIEAEEAGIEKIFGKATKRALTPGLNFILPFFTEVVRVNTKKNPYAHVEEGIDPADGFKLGVSYMVLAKFNPRYVWKFATGYNLPIDTNYFIDFMQKILRDICVGYTCDQLRTDAACRAVVQEEVHTRFIDMVSEKLDMSLFEDIDVIVKDYLYSPDYLALVERVKKAEKEAEAAEQEKKAVETLAEAQAKATRTKGDAENAVIEQLGQILRDHPEINQKTFFEHYPQFIGGGVMPTFNVGGIPSPTPTPTTPTTPTP